MSEKKLSQSLKQTSRILMFSAYMKLGLPNAVEMELSGVHEAFGWIDGVVCYSFAAAA